VLSKLTIKEFVILPTYKMRCYRKNPKRFQTKHSKTVVVVLAFVLETCLALAVPTAVVGTVQIPFGKSDDGSFRDGNTEDTYTPQDTYVSGPMLDSTYRQLKRENYEDMGYGRQIHGIDDLLDRDLLLPGTDDELVPDYPITRLEKNEMVRFNPSSKKDRLIDFLKDKKSPNTMNHFLRDRKGQKAMLHFLRDRKDVRNKLSHFLRDRKTYLTKNHFLRDRRYLSMDMLRYFINHRDKKELNHLLRDRRSENSWAYRPLR